MPVYFLSNSYSLEQSARVERQIKEVIPDLTRITNVENIVHKLSNKSHDPVYVVYLAPVHDDGYFDRLIDIASHYREHIFFILISEDISTTDYKRLVRTGGADWVSVGGAPQEIIDIIAKRRVGFVEAPPPATTTTPAAAPSPVVVAFVPSAGGVGNATLVTEIGVQLKTKKATKDRRVCIVDLDFQTSHLCDHLDLEPHLQIQEISSNPERFDAQLCELFASRHSSGLDVFAAPRSRFYIPDLNVTALDALFEMIARCYDLILIDLPVAWSAGTPDIVANADAVIVTGINTIPCLRQIAEVLAAIRSSRSGPIAVVLNRCQSTMTGRVARRKHVESVLPDEKIFYVRDAARAVAESINTGIPLTLNATFHKTAREIAAIAAFCAELKSVRAASEQIQVLPGRIRAK